MSPGVYEYTVNSFHLIFQVNQRCSDEQKVFVFVFAIQILPLAYPSFPRYSFPIIYNA